MADRRPVTLITGASSGIGWALAELFAAAGDEVVLIARRAERLQTLAAAIAQKGGRAIVLPLDLAAQDAGDRLEAELQARGIEPRVVVNNAGFGLYGEAAKRDLREQIEMVDLNVRTLTDFSLRWIDSLARHQGGILNLGSVAGFLPGPRMAVYFATKAYVLSFSEALHRELAPRGIRVTLVAPGPVTTEFAERAGARETAARKAMSHTAEDIARAAFDGFARGKRLVVPGVANKLVVTLLRLAPRGLMLASSEKAQSARHG